MDIQQLFHYVYTKVISITGYDHINISEFLLYGFLPIICLLIELAIKGYQKSSLRNLIVHFQETKDDFIWFLLDFFKLNRLLGVMLTLGLFYFFYGKIQKNFDFHLSHYIQNPYLQFALVFVLSDFKNYVRHYFQHRWGWVWELHKIHHSATRMTMLNLFRNNMVEVVWTSFLDVLLFVIIGAPIETYIFVLLLKDAHQYFLHSEIESDWGFIGDYVLVSPAAHRVHHSTNPKHYFKNIGNTFIFWDSIFNTYYKPQKGEVLTFGLDEDTYNKGILHDLFTSYRNSLVTAKKSFSEVFR
jgi:sterol desaturase/sphingolipid hydroxylase (fatty acid hydroxylase superfamily)